MLLGFRIWPIARLATKVMGLGYGKESYYLRELERIGIDCYKDNNIPKLANPYVKIIYTLRKSLRTCNIYANSYSIILAWWLDNLQLLYHIVSVLVCPIAHRLYSMLDLVLQYLCQVWLLQRDAVSMPSYSIIL